MAFVSIGQKYGFVSIGDSIRRQVAEARSEGESVGEARGEQKGRDAEKREMARGFRDDGVPVEIIARRTGFTKEEIEAL